MNIDDIQQKLALLPEGLAEENIQSWQSAIQYYQSHTSYPNYSFLLPLLSLTQKFSKSEQVKLFRTDFSLGTLMISTSTKDGFGKENPLITVDIKNEGAPDIYYFTCPGEWDDVITCKNEDIMSVMQPFLDRLWNETRGKKNV